jgi:ATPases with chaperone activity, ATP-binding subunit
MDYGKLTDHNGRTVDFRNVILCMTTNAGRRRHRQAGAGLRPRARHDEDDDAINRLFAPEFRNRLDAIIKFASLGPESMGRVVDKFIAELEVQLADRKVFIELSTAPAGGLPRRATTACSAPGHWPASSRSTSRSRSPRKCCSAS